MARNLTESIMSANIIRRRKALGLRSDDVARILGVSRATYSAYENRPFAVTLEKLNKVAKALNTNLDELLSGCYE